MCTLPGEVYYILDVRRKSRFGVFFSQSDRVHKGIKESVLLNIACVAMIMTAVLQDKQPREFSL